MRVSEEVNRFDLPSKSNRRDPSRRYWRRMTPATVDVGRLERGRRSPPGISRTGTSPLPPPPLRRSTSKTYSYLPLPTFLPSFIFIFKSYFFQATQHRNAAGMLSGDLDDTTDNKRIAVGALNTVDKMLSYYKIDDQRDLKKKYAPYVPQMRPWLAIVEVNMTNSTLNTECTGEREDHLMDFNQNVCDDIGV